MPRTKKTVTKASSPAKAAAKLVDAVAKKAEETKSQKAAPAKKEAVAEVKTNLVLQYAGKDASYDELVQNAKNVFQYDMGGDPSSINKLDLFVKPDENKVYFVINDETQGSYDL